jgi:hypothetical protein
MLNKPVVGDPEIKDAELTALKHLANVSMWLPRSGSRLGGEESEGLVARVGAMGASTDEPPAGGRGGSFLRGGGERSA